LARCLGVERAVVEDVGVEDEALVLRLRPTKAERSRCPHCGRRCPGYDAGGGPRRWRGPNVGAAQTFIEAEAPRVRCNEHGVLVARVPWARHRSTFTRAFEDTVAWLAQHTSKTVVSQMMRIAWETVGDIIERVVADKARGVDRLDGLRRIGIDEVSFRKGHKYLTVVVDHDSGRLVWAHEGKNAAAVRAFLDALGPERCARIEKVSTDGAAWIGGMVRERCPGAILCTDPFHVVAWATAALDNVRRAIWNRARKAGAKPEADAIKGTRFAICKNPENLTPRQTAKLSALEKLNAPLYRAYLLKEALRAVFVTKGEEGVAMLHRWQKWAQRCRIPQFVELARRVRRHRDGIEAALVHRVSNGRVEATNNQVRLLTRIAHGFHSAKALIAMMFLKLGGLDLRLPEALPLLR
jgi:transposase